MNEELLRAVTEVDPETSISLIKEMISQGKDPLEIIDVCRSGIQVVGERFARKEYFLTELVLTGQMLKDAMVLLQPLLRKDARDRLGVVVIGTVKGDIHDIGKNIVVTLLKSAGFEVHDLGVDVPASKFVEKAKETGARVVAMSALLTTAFEEIKATIGALEGSELKGKVKTLIGGAPVNERVRDYVGADFYGRDATEAVTICRDIMAQAV